MLTRSPRLLGALVGCLNLVFVSTLPAGTETGGLLPVRLVCEYRTNPLGLDVVQPRLSWVVQSLDTQARGQRQTAYQILVSDDPTELAAGRGSHWDSGKVASSQSVHVVYGGSALRSGRQYYWKVRVWDERDRSSPFSATARWKMGLLDASDWHAQWVIGEGPAFPWIRKTFTLAHRPQRGTAYVSVMGYYELYVNGNRVGDEALVPAVSDYTKRALSDPRYQRLSPRGQKLRGIVAGPGVVCAGHSRRDPGEPSGTGPVSVRVGRRTADLAGNRCLLEVAPQSHLAHRIQALTARPTTVRSLRLELSGWNETRLDDSAWEPVRTIAAPAVAIAAQACEPNRVVEIIRPIGIEEPVPGTYLVDMGRLFSGGLAIDVEGPRDTKVRFEYVEHRGPSGQMQTYNQAEEYVLRGGEKESFRTRLTYHAFRWVLIKGLPRKPDLEAVRGLMITTDMPRVAHFKCSNDLLNRIYETTLWTYRCLSLGGYTVDCPHRERLGYGGDAHATMETAMSNLAAGAFYTKWLADWRDAQQPNGDLPHVAPAVTFAGGGPAWSGICVALPWQVYRYYGDRRILETMYPTIERWLAFLDTKTKDHLLARYGHEEWGFLGDWVAPGKGQNVGERVDDQTTLFFNNCYYLYNLRQAAQVADVLGKTDDAAAYRRRADALRERIHKTFFHAVDSTYANGEQPYLAFALLAGVPPEDLRGKVLDRLQRAIRVSDKGHINAGIHGHYFLIKALLGEDRNDLTFTMVNQRTYPGWGSMLQQGATTIWEQWDGLNSHCHSSFLGVGLWFIQGLAGIRPDENAPGFEHILIRPAVVGDLTFAEAEFDSLHGAILSGWRLDAGRLTLRVTIPPNTSATVCVPAKRATQVLENGRPAEKAPGVRFLARRPEAAVYEIGSGTYHFTSTRP